MNWRVLAKKDVLDAHRKWKLGTAAAFFVLFLAVPTYFRVRRSSGGGFFEGLAMVVFLVPLAALMFGYDAISGERELGSLKLLLGLPYTRRDVVVGTAVGRVVVVAVATLVGVVAAAVVFVGFGGALPVVDFLVFAALVVLLGAAYAGSAVGFSAASPTSNRAMATSVGFFLLTIVGWSAVPMLFRYVVNGFSTPRGPRPEWAAFLDALSPVEAYTTATNALMRSGGTSVPTSDAFYHTGPFAVVVLFAWAVVPVAVGYRRFRATDL